MRMISNCVQRGFLRIGLGRSATQQQRECTPREDSRVTEEFQHVAKYPKNPGPAFDSTRIPQFWHRKVSERIKSASTTQLAEVHQIGQPPTTLTNTRLRFHVRTSLHAGTNGTLRRILRVFEIFRKIVVAQAARRQFSSPADSIFCHSFSHVISSFCIRTEALAENREKRDSS